MSFFDAIVAVEKLVKDNWATTPIQYENVPFTPAKDSSGNPRPYIALVLRETPLIGGAEITLGSANPQFRWGGVIVTQVFIPENYSDRGLAKKYTDQLKGLFRRSIDIAYKTDISVLTIDNSFNSLTTDFLTLGIVVGMSLTIRGFTNIENNGVFVVQKVTQRKITLDPDEYTLVEEVAGQTIFMTGVKTISYRNSGFIRTHLGSATAVGNNNGWWQENLTVRYERDAQS